MRRRVSFELIVTLEEEEEKGRRQCTGCTGKGREEREREREEWGQNKSRQEWSINVINSPYSFYYWWEAN